MRPEGVVLPAPSIGQGLCLGHGGEELRIQEFITEAAVERFGKAVLPRRAWLDIGRCRGAAFCPAPEGVGNEFWPVVAADVRRCRVKAGQLFQHRHHVFGLAAPAHSDGQTEAAVFIDHVEELEPPAVSGGVELEVHGPDLVRVFGLMAPQRTVCWPGPLLLTRSGALEPFLTPEPVYPLVVHPAPADVRRTVRCALQRSGDLAETTPQLSLLDRDDLGRMTLGAAVLAHHSADLAFRGPVTLLQDYDSPAATFRAQKFPSARSLSIAFSRSASARSFLSRAFSFSS